MRNILLIRHFPQICRCGLNVVRKMEIFALYSRDGLVRARP